MAHIVVQPDCNNAPKKTFLKDFESAFATKDISFILECMDENIVWEMVGDRVIKGKESAKEILPPMLDGSMKELVIETIITHGDEGCVSGKMKFNDGTNLTFCDVFTFTSHAANAKLKKLTAFVIEDKKPELL